MTLGPIHVGDLEPPISGQVTKGGAAYPLTDCTLTLHFYCKQKGIHFLGHGQAQITSSLEGKFIYALAPGDTDENGTWAVYLVVLKAGKLMTIKGLDTIEILPNPLGNIHRLRFTGRMKLAV